MRILVCAPFELTALRGNSVAARRLGDAFARRGHAVEILERCERLGIEDGARSARAFRPDVALTMHAWRCAPVFHGIRSACPAPIAVTLRGTDINEMIADPAREPAIRSVLESCDGIAVFNEAMRDAIAARAPAIAAKVRLIPNAAELPRSAVDYRARLGLPREAFVFLGLAAVRPEKRIALAIRGLARVHRLDANVIYVHAGPVIDGAAGAELRALRAEHPWVRDAGSIPREEVDSLLRAGDAFISASRSEGMPHAVSEAMLAGLPLLLSDIDGHRAMAAEGIEALFFDAEDSLAAEASRLAADPALRSRLGAAARAHAERACRPDAEAEAYLALFEALLIPREGSPTAR